MAALNVATTINPRFDHVTPIESTRSEVTITHRCHTLAEVMAVARSGLVDIVLIADDTELVGLETLQQIRDLEGHGPRLAVISDVADERQRLSELNIPVASPQLSGPELADWLQEVARDGTTRQIADSPLNAEDLQILVELDPETASKRPRGRRAAPYDPTRDLVPEQGLQHLSFNDESNPQRDEATESTASSAATADAMQSRASSVDQPSFAGVAERPRDELAESDSTPSHTVAVWGPTGAPGRTTVAVNLAVEAALRGHKTLLIDADTYGASVAVHLGLLEETAAIAQACRAAEHRGLNTAGLVSHTQRVVVRGMGLDVITGLTRSERWPQVRAAAWAQVLDVARGGWDVIIIDCGFGLEEDEELSFDIPAPQRNATTRTALSKADTVITVGTGDPVGFVRYMKDIEQLMEATQGRIVPIVNKVTSMTSGMSPKRQLRSVWERFGPNVSLQQFIGWAPEVTAAALLNGKTLAESAPKSEIRLAIQRLMEACVPSLSASSPTSQQPSTANMQTRAGLLKFTKSR